MTAEVTYQVVDNKDSLRELCALVESLEPQDFISLDTEFMRITSYYPDFSLLQLAIKGQNYLVDMWVLGEQALPLIVALCHTTAGVLSFGSIEDIGLIALWARKAKCTPVLPMRFYDLQLMLSFSGQNKVFGLREALQSLLGVTLNKEYTRSNWTQRPLATEQLRYSALDVNYLEPLYHLIYERMPVQNFSYFVEEMHHICGQFVEEDDPDEAYLSISAAGMLSLKELNVLHYLARERMIYGMQHNQALNRVITSKAMWQLARFTPSNKQELLRRGVNSSAVRRHAPMILEWIKAAKRAPQYEHLTIPYDYFSHQRALQENFDYLKKQIRERLQQTRALDEHLLLRKSLLNDYFRSLYLGTTPLLQQSWRLKVLGKLDVPLEPLSRLNQGTEEGSLGALSKEGVIMPPPFLTFR